MHTKMALIAPAGIRQRHPATISVRHGQGEAQNLGRVHRSHGLSREISDPGAQRAAGDRGASDLPSTVGL